MRLVRGARLCASVLALVVSPAPSACSRGTGRSTAEESSALPVDVTGLVQGADARRREALAGARDRVSPRPDLGPCQESLHPTEETMPAVEGDDAAAKEQQLAMDGVGIALAAEVGTKPGPLAIRLESLGRDERATKGEARERALRLMQRAKAGQDFELIIDREAPHVLEARAYLWDYAKGALVCAADVRVEGENLRQRALDAMGSLYVAGPAERGGP